MKRIALVVAVLVGCGIDESGEPRMDGQPPIGLPETDFLGQPCDLAVSVCRETNPTAYCVDEGEGSGTCRPACDVGGTCHGLTQGGTPVIVGDVCVCVP